MKSKLLLLMLVITSGSSRLLYAQEVKANSASDTLVVLWSSGDPEVAEKLINEEHAEYFLSELLLPEMETPETLSYILRLGRQHPGMKVGVLSNVDLAPYEIPFNMLSLRKVSLLPSDLESAINEYWLP